MIEEARLLADELMKSPVPDPIDALGKLGYGYSAVKRFKDLNASMQRPHIWDMPGIREMSEDPVLQMDVVEEGEYHDAVMSALASSHPSDYLICNEMLVERMYDLLSSAGVDKEIGVPSDIFVSGTIPIPDMVMSFEGDVDTKFRILTGNRGGYFVFDDCAGTESFSVALTFGPPEDVGEDVGVFFMDISTSVSTHPEVLKRYLDRYHALEMYLLFDQVLKLWYAFQILLLNPATKPVLMKRSGKEKLNGACMTSRKTGKRKACYVKRHRVETDIFDRETSTDGVDRKTLSWYVVGHWRNYQSGKKSFVKGYWKGPLRHLERNLDDGRERRLA